MRYSFHGGLLSDISLGKFHSDLNISEFSPKEVIVRNFEENDSVLSVGSKISRGAVIPCGDDVSAVRLFPVNGRIKEINRARIVIETDPDDGSCTKTEGVADINTPLADTDPAVLRNIIKKAAIATPACPHSAFSVCEKTASFDGIKRVVVDCTSAEPSMHTNRYILKELTSELFGGIRILIRATEAIGAVIIADESHMPSVRTIEKNVDGKFMAARITDARYPISNTKLLLHATIGKECPPDKSPSDYGCAIFDAEACVAVYNAVAKGIPMTERLISVEHKKSVSILRLPLGTRLLDAADSIEKETKFISLGAYKPLHPREKLENAVISASERMLVLKEKAVRIKAFPCSGCMKCEDVCPMYLSPYKLLLARKKKQKQKELGVECCIHCNCCSAICPSGIDIPHYFSKEDSI